MIKIEFEIIENDFRYRDALHLPDDHNLSEADIEAMKRERFDNCLAVIAAATMDTPSESE